ncbi:Charged multivesicular body protein, putative [Pediculus humanus corporis]|uniref:Charged multivesicular body protein, putative n=1 Tax=Pediculus humanus subsp. corporis TaxID=121224 RepID=E0VVA7_PEDHC|nr:Charged multivesicular body protein, putative [Pediculus humanus corporis]EEB17313.1 Charged multivesicular body protein, putative [Pediculus humanus corporis]
MGLFGRTQEKSPKDMVTEWTQKLRKEGYSLDRQVRGIQREEEKIKRSLKDAAKKGDKDVCVILAKEVIRARKAIGKIQTTKAHINSVQLQMKNQLATLRVAGSLSKSTEVMNAMQNLLKLSDVSDTMRELSREMMKAGIIEEMLEETFEGMEDQDEMEEEAQEQVDKILWEVTQGTLGKAPAAVTDTLPSAEPAASTSYEENEEELDDMRSRLAALRS